MATTTMGQTPNTTSSRNMVTNRSLYWGIAAVLAILLIFAFTANRNATVVAPVTQGTEYSPAMDSTPTLRETETMGQPSVNSVNTAPPPVSEDFVPTDRTMMENNNGVLGAPMESSTPTTMEPGTSVSPEAPKGTVERK